MNDAVILSSVIEKFISLAINLSPNSGYKDEERTILRHQCLENHGAGMILENSSVSSTKRPVCTGRLMMLRNWWQTSSLCRSPTESRMQTSSYYDGTCGTGGMLTVV